jgi:hypothetical protein
LETILPDVQLETKFGASTDEFAKIIHIITQPNPFELVIVRGADGCPFLGSLGAATGGGTVRGIRRVPEEYLDALVDPPAADEAKKVLAEQRKKAQPDVTNPSCIPMF